MPFFTEKKVARLLRDIRPTIHRQIQDIPRFKFREGDAPGAESPGFDDHDWANFDVGNFWGGYDVTAWFRARVPIPAAFRGKKLALRFRVGPLDGGESAAETMLYVNGAPLQAIDLWHEEAWLPPEHRQGDTLFIALKAWSGVLSVPDRRRFKLARLVQVDENAEGYYFLADTLLKAIKELPENDWRRVRLLETLNGSVRRIDFTRSRSDRYYESLGEARDFLRAELDALQKLEPEKPTVIAVGHAHIDMAWLWRLSHSREKAARTFLTALHLMRQYPEYRFLHSSPQVYKFLKQDYPDIFARVKERIASGEWEITGGMWIEPDTNLTSGESLIRQILYGKRYIRQEFGQETNVVWLPDVFGYSGALPQIIVKSGMKIFTTTKISWSQFNRFPYDTFRWRGIDGTEILTHFITTPDDAWWFYTYNAVLTPFQVKGIWDQYRSKAINDELLIAFGWGDGGGGPTKEMLESGRGMVNLPGIPRVEMGKVEPYFARMEERLKDKDVPVWDGELYLEYHRGTFTSQAQVKRANRKAEILYHNAEWLSTLASVLAGAPYATLQDGWEMIMLNQFHDILPGSSIHDVYEDAAQDYVRIEQIGQAAATQAQETLLSGIAADQESVVVFNPLGWEQSGLIELPWSAALDGKALQGAAVQVIGDDGDKKILLQTPPAPALGYQAFPLRPAESSASAMTITPERLENRFYRLTLNGQGQITSLLDKVNRREVLAPGARGGVFQTFEDRPMQFDAWDIDIYYQEKMREIADLVEVQVEESGPLRGALRLRWRFEQSTITQRLTLYADSPRIDFRTEADWHEQQILLKVAFPVNVRSTRATYDIQFGSVERPTHWNTSWDYARFEVVGHKWADLSEGNYGVSLLNDCKYGYDVKDNVMRLTLIKSAIYPDPQADQGKHIFTYSLLPHAGDWRSAIGEGYALNNPLQAAIIPAQPGGSLPRRFSFVEADAAHVIIETVKKAEDGDAWIVRVYESQQCRTASVTLTFGQPLRHVVECNLVEEGESAASYAGHSLSFAITPFEIKTFKVWFD